MIYHKLSKYHKENPYKANYVWYREHRHISDYITFEPSDLVNPSLKKITKKSKPYVFIGSGFDCETSKEHKHSTISHVYIWQFSIGKITFLCRDYNSIERFINELSDLVKQVHDNATLIIWDANIKYEYSYFKEIFKSHITDIFAKSKTNICSFTINNNLLFRECLGVFGRSLANIAKLHCTTQKRKGDLDYDLIFTPHTHLNRKQRLYCVNDVAILSELTLYAFTEYILQGKKIPLTATGIVRQEITSAIAPTSQKRKNLTDSVKLTMGTEQEYNTFRNFLYSGGLTHSNYKYVGLKLSDVLTVNPDINMHIACADLTSAYPWALLAKSYPDGELIHTNNIKLALQHKHWLIKLELHNIRSKSTHSTISMHKCMYMSNPIIDNGRIYRADSITVWCTEIDYSNIKAIYDFDNTSKILDCYYFTKSSYVNQKILDVMCAWYIKKARIKSKSKTNPEVKKEYDELKRRINSVYGMFVTRVYTTNYKWKDGEITEETCDYDSSTPLFNPFIGYYCTAYVRQRLIQCISAFPDSIVQYDTDSIYWDTNNKELDTYIDKINTDIYNELLKRTQEQELLDLGQWDKTDGDYPMGFMGLGSKRYIGTHSDGSHKITFAGASDTDILNEATRTNTDIYTYLKSFNILSDNSTKTGAVHSKDTYYTYQCTDCKGNTYPVESYGYTTIVNVPFKAMLSHNFENLRNRYINSFYQEVKQ